MRRLPYHIISYIFLCIIVSCSYSKKFTRNYYKENETTLQSIRQRFKDLHDKHPFSLELKDQRLRRIGIEIQTDSIKYIYTFRTDEPYLLDTLYKYQFDVKPVSEYMHRLG